MTYSRKGESFSIGIGNVTPDNILSELGIAPAMERCVNLNIYAIKRLYYHWAIEKIQNLGYTLSGISMLDE